jgi:hypothetical protein
MLLIINLIKINLVNFFIFLAFLQVFFSFLIQNKLFYFVKNFQSSSTFIVNKLYEIKFKIILENFNLILMVV